MGLPPRTGWGPTNRGDRHVLSAAALLAFCGAALLSGFWSIGPAMGTSVPIVAMIMVVVAAGITVSRTIGLRQRGKLIEGASAFVAASPAPCFVTDQGGVIACRNNAALVRFPDRANLELADYFTDCMADPAATLGRMMAELGVRAHVSEDVVMPLGRFRLTASRVGQGVYIWRLEDGSGRDGAVLGTFLGANALGLPMMIIDAAGEILFGNEAFRRLTGGQAHREAEIFLTPPTENGQVHSIASHGGTIDCVVARAPGLWGRQEVYFIPVPARGSQWADPLGWDAVEDLPVALLKVGADGEIRASNREARALLPIARGQTKRLSDLIEGLGRPINDWLAETIRSGRPSGTEFLRGRALGQDRFVQVALNPCGAAEEAELIAVLTDATELKSLEAQFVQSQKMQAIGQLAGGVAHDFNNLLTAISGHCDLLLLRHDQSDQDYADLIQIHQNANRAAGLVGQLLAFSRKQNLMPAVIDLRDTLSDLTHLLNRLVGERVALTLSHDPALRHIRADKRQLEQVMMNLVVNARDAMPQGGEITIETGNLSLAVPIERDRARVPPGDYVVVRVHDNGSGIQPERLPKIFEPFFTTKRPGEGTGLGLSTVYGIIKQTGGFIFVDSELGKGTTFTLYLPGTDQPLATALENPRPVEPDPDRVFEGIVLLVEDEAPVRAFASLALRLHGFSVLEADSAETALGMLSDPGIVVDIIVTDVIMPGKDGPTWVREALQTRPDTKVVFVSGYAEEAFSDDKAMIPNSVFLPKPFSLKQLTGTVSRQLQSATDVGKRADGPQAAPLPCPDGAPSPEPG